MNIFTVEANLKNMIANKQTVLDSLDITKVDPAVAFQLSTQVDELNQVLKDVRACREKAIEDSWRNSPDRMGQ